MGIKGRVRRAELEFSIRNAKEALRELETAWSEAYGRSDDSGV